MFDLDILLASQTTPLNKSGFFPSCNFVNFVNLNDNEPTEARGYQWYGVTSHVDILNILMKFLFG